MSYEYLKRAEQVLVYTNKARDNINKMFRNSQQFYDYLPMDGDKLVATRNLWEQTIDGTPIINGTTGYCRGIHIATSSTAYIYFQPDFSDKTITLLTCINNFYNKPFPPINRLATFDFGYALTVHKAQGSEWGKVAVYQDFIAQDESRWLYTAVTRAKDKVLIFR